MRRKLHRGAWPVTGRCSWFLARWLRGAAAHSGVANLVRRLTLVGAGPGGGEGIHIRSPEVSKVAGRAELGLEEFNYLFSFDSSDEALAAGKTLLGSPEARGGVKPLLCSQ
jgi:hypothetical protein